MGAALLRSQTRRFGGLKHLEENLSKDDHKGFTLVVILFSLPDAFCVLPAAYEKFAGGVSIWAAGCCWRTNRSMELVYHVILLITLLPRPINPSGHLLDPLHHLFQHRFLREEDNFAGGILKHIAGDIQTTVDEQQEMFAMRGAEFFHFAPQVFGMPEAYEFDKNLARFILVVNQRKIGNHHRIAEQQDLAFASQ